MDHNARASSDPSREANRIWALMGLSPAGSPISEVARQAHVEVRRESRFRMGEQEKQLRAAERRRRLGPLRDALQQAREGGDEGSWAVAMSEMAQVALDSDHPEREAANLLIAAQVSLDELPARAARALVEPIRCERALPEAKPPAFGFALSGRSEELARVWLVAVKRAQKAAGA